MQFVLGILGILRGFLQKLGPYLVLEILLPGGTLFALLLFLYRRRQAKVVRAAPRSALAIV